jgi:fused signal recognition particle receptor
MLHTTETVILVSIFVLAAALIALPKALGRRARRKAAAAETGEALPEDDAQPEEQARREEPAEGLTAGPEDVERADAPERAPRRRLRDRLGKSRAPFAGMRGRMRARRIDDDAWDDLEETLLLADTGLPTTTRLVDAVRKRAADRGVGDAAALPELLGEEIIALLGETAAGRELDLEIGHTTAWMLVGVNGAGKTTTAAKLATRELAAGHSVMLAAADTFRAAAADQLAAWGDRLGVDVIRGQEGGDPGAVAFDAVQAGVARSVDLVIVDTAGRLHTKVNLMAELEKVRRVIERTPDVLREVLLVLDATTGQNGLAQAKQFRDSVGVTGVVLAKLDGTAKGGIVLAIESELGVPVKLVGLGETPADLVPFDPAEFAAALVGGDDSAGDADEGDG